MPRPQTGWTLDVLLSDWSGDTLPRLPLGGVCQDSRLVNAGDLYLATSGASTHGLLFAEAAVRAGAAAVAGEPDALAQHAGIVQRLRARAIPVVAVPSLDSRKGALAARFHHHPDRDMTLIAVTGTDGKTSVCRFIAQAFCALDRPCGYIGTLGWGLGEQLQSTELTTPDAVSLYRMLAEMRSSGAELVALEASSHGLAEHRLDGLALDVAVLTNLGRDHLDYHGTLEAYRDAKGRLFTWPGLSAMVVNGQDAFGCELLRRHTTLRRVAFARREPDGNRVNGLCDDSGALLQIIGQDVQASDAGLRFTLTESRSGPAATGPAVTPEHALADSSVETPSTGPAKASARSAFEPGATPVGDIVSPLLGRFNVDNLLACYACLRVCDVAANEARHALSSVKPVAGRMERFGQPGRPTVVVDFSHTPQALSVAIAAARVHCHGELWVVFGCGGDRDPGKRAPMAAAAEAADHVVLTDDNPRTERSEDIIADAMAGFSRSDEVTVIADRRAAIAHAIARAGVSDLVLIAGKGHEDYQIIGTTRHHFSDREEVLCALEQAS